MMTYLVKTPFWLKKLYGECTWDVKTDDNVIYLTFDDGPHPTITDFVLDELSKFEAAATFFCIGNNVENHPDVYTRILQAGHAVGNHTQSHVNGWSTEKASYLRDIMDARKWIDSELFRPPYGRITKSQLRLLQKAQPPLHPIMWTVLSGDFDEKLSEEQCLKNVINNARRGSIIVFHDSDKAAEKLKFALPKVLQIFSEKGFAFKKLETTKKNLTALVGGR